MKSSLSLRARLLLTYVLLLAVTLGVITAAFILFLNTREAPPQQTYQRLASIVQGIPLGEILVEAEIAALRTPADRADVIQAELDILAEERNVRILVLDARDGTVIYDSANTIAAGQSLALRPERYTIPAAIRRGFPSRVETVFGSFEDTSGEWLFAGLVVTGVRANTSGALLFADPPDNQSLQQALADYGSALLLPLCQSSIIGLIVALILAVIGSRSIARPLQQLAGASERVAEGHYDQRVPATTGPAEVRAVAEAFNNMIEQVERTRRAQQDFLANVSHDLKTPLTSIRGYSQAIMDGAASNPVQAANIIYDEAGRMNRMVVELTDLARLQAGRLSMDVHELDLGQITTAVGERLAIVAREKGISLHVNARPMPPVSGDGDRLAQVLMNLIGNAIKYTPSGGRISIETRVANHGVEVVVQDNGIGIPADELPRIFERFYQIDKARGPERGTGLGLVIAHEIVQAHGGQLDVASAGMGHGATFTLWLPLAGRGAAGRS